MRYRLRRADGVYRWMSSRAEPMRDHAGRILHWYGLCHDIDDQVHAEEELRNDITERKKTEEVLRQREHQLQVLVDAIPAYIWCLTPEGTPSYFNKRVIDQIGLTVADLTAPDGSLRLESVHPGDRPAVEHMLMHSLETGAPFSLKYRQRRGKADYRWTQGLAEALRDDRGRIVQWYGVYLDIEDEVVAQQALRDRERELSQLVDMMPGLLWRLSPDGEPIFFNRRMIDFLGMDGAHADKSGTDRLAAIIRAVVHPDDAGKVEETLNRCILTGEHFSMTYRLRRTDGIYRWMSGRAEPMRDEEGCIVQWYGLSHDIDDQVRAQEALRERERTLRQLVETLPAMIDCAAPNGEPIYRSRQLREFLGYELEELDGEGKSRLQATLAAGVHPADLADVKDDYARSLSTGEPYARRHRLRRFDGEYRWVETRAAPMRSSEGAIVQWNVICLDIDGEVRAQMELRSAQDKMARASQAASLAELSASIAHEVNQPLAAIVATSHACRRWLSADPPNLERAGITLDRIIRDANSASDVVSRIRALFSQASKSRTRVDMAEVIREVCLLLAGDLAAKSTQVETEFSRTLPQTLVDRVQMQQVLVNLIRNAIDAMEEVVDRPRRIRIRAFPDGAQSVRIELQDQGTGLREPERAFEPFFTTKQNGMGMGLAICRSIIESHDGRLWVQTSGPEGTTLAFTLPCEARASA
jgi:PAS domain S-box-containing protein